jgi:hypothetical protein
MKYCYQYLKIDDVVSTTGIIKDPEAIRVVCIFSELIGVLNPAGKMSVLRETCWDGKVHSVTDGHRPGAAM